MSKDFSPKSSMALQSNCISVCSFNCRSAKSSINEIYDLCCNADMVFLQEHWLLPNEISLLSDIHPDFVAIGHSAVDLSQGVLVGRPYGGTGIMYRKSFGECITRVITYDSRITAVILQSNYGPVLFVSVYMPTNYGDADCYEEYVAICGKITALFAESDAIHMVVVGDFNCQAGSRFF